MEQKTQQTNAEQKEVTKTEDGKAKVTKTEDGKAKVELIRRHRPFGFGGK
ncbi:MAG: hypothetical protein LBD53_04300 [Tannerella sp.]|jgi:hypothetical protein|nr:hypothetical protein [Tannerella sp.]